MMEWILIMGSGGWGHHGQGAPWVGGGTCVAGPWRRGWRSRSPRPSGGVHRRPATLILMGALMPRSFQSSRGRLGRGLGQRPISSLSVPASVCPSPSKFPECMSLDLCLRSSYLPPSLCQPPPPGAQLTCSPSSSSWDLSASIPWRGETDGGGVAGIWRRAEP